MLYLPVFILFGLQNLFRPDPPLVYQAELLTKVNLLRQHSCRCGNVKYPAQPKLVWNDKIALACFEHATEISQRNLLSHKGINGGSAANRLKGHGYFWKLFAENIAMGYDTSDEVFDAWLKSPSHCKNLMGNYAEMAVVKVGEYWVMDFGTQKQSPQ